MPYIGTQPSQSAFVVDTFNGTGSQTVFTMSVAPAGTTSVLVAVSGVLQDPSTYSVSGTTLTFSSAPPSGTGNISARYLGIPASGVTTTAYRTVTTFTATAGQTTFTPPSYTAGFINVYRNGVLLTPTSDYTATNGTTVVLASGATAGDTVIVESFLVSSVLNAIPALASSVPPSYLTQPFTSGTAQASTSGTSITFTGIPNWVKRVTVMLNAVVTNGSSLPLIQIGSGSVTNTGYISRVSNIQGSTASTGAFTTGFGLIVSGNYASTTPLVGTLVLTLIGSNAWVASGNIVRNDGGTTTVGSTAGSLTLSGALDRVVLTTVNGTDTFTAGSINILYE